MTDSLYRLSKQKTGWIRGLLGYFYEYKLNNTYFFSFLDKSKYELKNLYRIRESAINELAIKLLKTDIGKPEIQS